MHTDLATFFRSHTIPQVEQREKTFLEISQQPHYENVLSNMYAFFFRVNEEHGLQDLFLSALKSFINERASEKEFEEFENPHVETEKQTKNNGRIDLLLHNKQGTIIIENKVYHHIKHNDLDDYWKSVAAKSDQHKVGIILSLYPIDPSQYGKWKSAPHYFNLTHLELMNLVMELLESYKKEASPKFLVFLEDFYQNIKNLSDRSMKEEDLTFYLEHRKPIHDAAKLKFHFKNYVKKEAANAKQRLSKDLKLVNKYHKDRLVYFASQVNNQLMFTVLFEKLLKGKNSIHLMVELHGDVKEKFQQHPELYTGVPEADHRRNTDFGHVKGYWAHFANEYIGFSDDEIMNLSESIATKINQSPLFQIFNTLEEALKLEKR